MLLLVTALKLDWNDNREIMFQRHNLKEAKRKKNGRECNTNKIEIKIIQKRPGIRILLDFLRATLESKIYRGQQHQAFKINYIFKLFSWNKLKQIIKGVQSTISSYLSRRGNRTMERLIQTHSWLPCPLFKPGTFRRQEFGLRCLHSVSGSLSSSSGCSTSDTSFLLTHTLGGSRWWLYWSALCYPHGRHWLSSSL